MAYRGAHTAQGPDTVGHDQTQTPEPSVVGNGWSGVAVVDAGPLLAEANTKLAASNGSAAQAQESALFELLTPVSGSWGSGRLLDGTLGSVVIAADGRIAAGLVGPDQLYAALGA